MVNFKNTIVLNSIGDKGTTKSSTYADLKSGKKWIKNFLEIMPCNIQRVSMKGYNAEELAVIKLDMSKIATVAKTLIDNKELVAGDSLRVLFRIAPDGFPAAAYDSPLTYNYQDKLMIEFTYCDAAVDTADNFRNALKSALRIEDARFPKLADDDMEGEAVVKLALESEMKCSGLIIETVEKDWQDYPTKIEVIEKANLASASADPKTILNFSAHVSEFGGFNSLCNIIFPTGANTAWGADDLDAKPIMGCTYSQILVTCSFSKEGYGYDAIGGKVKGVYTKEIWVEESCAITLYNFLTDGQSENANATGNMKSGTDRSNYPDGVSVKYTAGMDEFNDVADNIDDPISKG